MGGADVQRAIRDLYDAAKPYNAYMYKAQKQNINQITSAFKLWLLNGTCESVFIDRYVR